MVKGLYYVPNYLTAEEQKNVLKFLNKTNKLKGIGKKASTRKVIHYGYSYAYDRSGIKKIDEIPKFFKDIVDLDRVNANIEVNLCDEDMEQLIINEYNPGQGIYPHIDHVKYFGPIIVCLTVGSGIGIDFSRKDNPNVKKTVFVEPGSLYIMSGDSRYKWKHGIRKAQYDNGKKRGTRYSLTYRTVLTENL